ncbi:lipid A deacylase LpxR family protein [Flavihumibacter sp. R14]|nr:lipid A deacylase LpxR family protein [Flavihumibacter soli]
MNYRFILYFFSLTLFGSLAKGQTSGYKNEFGFRSENDAYLGLGRDRYYTNGLFFTFRHATDQSRLKDRVNKRIWEIEAGQKMYNPISGYITSTDRIDRPFAGYLYAGGSINWLYNSEHNLKVGFQAGTIGPSSLAEDGQVFLHELVGFYEIKGWDSQVKDEFGLNVLAEYNHFIHRSANEKTDFTLTSFAQLGNTFTGAGLGLLFRAGSVNKFFNSASTTSTLSHNSKTELEEQKEFFFYAKPSLYYTVYDATVEGGFFREDKGPITFDVKSIIFSQQIGFIYSKKRWTADISVIFKSREIQSSARAHQYGSGAFYYRFN